MKLLKVFSISLFVFLSLIQMTPAFAEVAPAIDPSSPKAIVLATVNISNYKIVSQKDNIFKIIFSLSNRTGAQSGIKYGVELQGTDSKKNIIDQKVYPDSVTLSEGSRSSKEITYEAPRMLSGTYDLRLVSKNESSFPLANVSLGKVTLKSSASGLEIFSSSCFLQISGKKDAPHFDIAQNVSLEKGETLHLTCDALNSTDKDISVVPSFNTFYKTQYGATAPQVGGSTEAVSFKSKEKKSFSLVLPVVVIPQSYNINVKLADNGIISNPISVTYTVAGSNATIQNLLLDKDSYKNGDKAVMSLVFNGNIKNFENTPSIFIVKASVVNSNNEECIDPINQTVTQNPNNPMVEIPAFIKKDCLNPKAVISLSDDKGNVLDQKNFLITSDSVPVLVSAIITNNNLLIIIISICVIVFAGIAFYFISLRKKDRINQDLNKSNETEIK